jgi:hypothetical protein
MADKAVGEAVALLQWLSHEADVYFRTAPKKHKLAHDRLAGIYPLTSDIEFGRLRRGEVESMVGHLHSWPIDHGNPVLYPVSKCELKRVDGVLNVRFQVGLFAMTDAGAGADSVNDGTYDVLASSGWRFESPSSWEQSKAAVSEVKSKPGAIAQTVVGSHEYFHAQAIQGFGKDGKFEKVLLPVNERQPAFRLDANSCASLLMIALVSLYGLQPHLRGLLNQPEVASKDMRNALVPVKSTSSTGRK